MSSGEQQRPVPPRRCPVVHVADITPCDEGELEPLRDHLRTGAAVTAPVQFQRGTVFPDGRLDLCKQSLGPGGLRQVLGALGAQPHVRHLLLGTDGLGEEGAEAVAAHIEAHDDLETVFLGCNAIPPVGVERLATAIGGSATVRALWLKRNLLGVEGARHVASLLASEAPLEVLDLVNTELGDEGVEIVCEAAAGHRTLRWLYLGGNGVTERGARSVATLLRASPALTGLSLAVNRLGDPGARALAEGLAAWSGGQELLLASNDIGPEAAEALVQGLAGMPALWRLDLSLAPSTWALEERPNRLGDAGVTVLARWLASDPPLRALDLRNNGMTSRSALVLEEALGHNTHLCRLRMGKDVSRRIKRRIGVRLTANAATIGEAGQMPWHIAAIQSVYRT